MKKLAKRWLAFMLVLSMVLSDSHVLRASAVEITEDATVQSEAGTTDVIEPATEETLTEAVTEELTEDVLEEEAEEALEEEDSNEELLTDEALSDEEELLGASYIGQYDTIYVGSSDDATLSKIAATLPLTAYASTDTSRSNKLTLTNNWTYDSSSGTFKNSYNGTAMSIPATYYGQCDKISFEFVDAAVQAGSSYQVKTYAPSATYNIRRLYKLSNDKKSSTDVWAKQKITTANYAVSSTNATTSDTGEYVLATYQNANTTKVYYAAKTASFEVRSNGYVASVAPSMSKIYIPSAMNTSTNLANLAKVLPRVAKVTSDLKDSSGDEVVINVKTKGAWTLNQSAQQFEAYVDPSSLSGGITDGKNILSSTKVVLPYEANDTNCGNISLSANVTTVSVGSTSTMTLSGTYYTNPNGVWLLQFPGSSNSNGAIYDTSSSAFDTSSSALNRAKFNLTNLQTTQSGDYYAVLSAKDSYTSKYYAYITKTPVKLTVNSGQTSCSHVANTPTFKWSPDHKSCTYTIKCSKCGVTLVDSGTATVTKQTTAATCQATGKTVYTATATYNGQSYTDTYTETLTMLAHTLPSSATFTWSSDHKSCSYVIKCSKCSTTMSSGSATVKQENTSASCTTGGGVVYTATVTYSGKTYNSDPYSVQSTPLGHIQPDTATFTWSSDYKTCNYTIKCARTGCTATLASGAASVSQKETAANCTTDGSIVYTATTTYNGRTYTDTKTKKLTALGHSASDATFTWASDYKSCNYTIKCSRCSATMSSGAATVSQRDTAPSCTTGGGVEYIASVTYNGKTETNTYSETKPALGHNLSTTFTWSDDHETCNYVISCSRCNPTLKTGAATVNKTTTNATCTDKGSILYQASVVYNGVTYNAPSYTATINALGHSANVNFNWASNHETCSYNVTCSRCYTSLESGSATVTKNTTAATCEADGKTVYKASATYGGKTYNASDYTATIAKLGHDITGAVFTWSGDHETCTYAVNCDRCKASLATGSATVKKDTTAATCNVEGKTVYSASASYNGKTYNADSYTKVLGKTAHTPKATFAFTTDNSYSPAKEICTYKITCSSCSQQLETGTTTFTDTVTKAATCEADGLRQKVASVNYNGTTYTSLPNIVTIPKLGHVKKFAFTWSGDHESCQYTVSCTRTGCNKQLTSGYATVKKDTTPATCTVAGKTVYTASVTYDGETANAPSYTKALDIISHSYVNGSYEAPTYRKQGHQAGRYCSVCGKSESDGNTISELKFRVNFNGNNNTAGTMSAQTNLSYISGGTLTKNAFTRTNYVFTGWNSNANGTGTSFTNQDDIRKLIELVEANYGTVTLYAQWQKTQCTIKYNMNGGTNSSLNKTTLKTTDLPFTLTNPTKPYYDFVGWYKDSALTQSISSTITSVENDLNLYAKWKEKAYSIQFHGNDATSGSTSTLTGMNVNSGNTIPASGFVRTGYVFNGWNTKADGTGTKISVGTPVSTVITTVEASGSEIHLYAQWVRDQINIYYKLNGGVNAASNPAVFSMNTIKLANPTKPGFTFNGWYLESTYKNKITSITTSNINSILVEGNVFLYAKWTANKYYVKFVGNGATSGTMSTITGNYKTGLALPANAFKRKGCSFKYWKDENGVTYKNKADLAELSKSTTKKLITLTAQWKYVDYSITYVMNGGTNNSKNPATYKYTTSTITLQKPTKRGYDFAGWFSDSACTKKVTQIAKNSTGNKTLYAKWKVHMFSITYVLNSGTNNSSNLTKYKVSQATFQLLDPTRKGYTFRGWYTDTTYKTKVTEIKKGTVGNKTFYAKWAKTEYTITYIMNGGTNNSNNIKTYNISTPDFKFYTPRRTGYKFVGWFTDKACTKQIKTLTKGSTGNKTLYAKWQVQ